ncbi:MAG: MG2 domain-containing protein [Acetobacteraceae bacterium]
MRRFGLLLAALLCLACGRAWADDFALPGLESDSGAYARTLTARFPAGGTPQARRQAEQAAAAAVRKQDWAAAAAAWETRIAQGDATPAQWLSLAEAQMRRTPPEAARALQAAWQNFSGSETGAAELPSLLLMADALKALNRPTQAIQALEAAVERAPDNKAIAQRLDETRRATGILVRRVTTEADAEPPRACIGFTVAPVRRDDFHAEDWVRLDPPVPGAAVTREGDLICVSGLPSGATTRVLLRAGMPGESGLSLVKDTALNVAMANRRPRIDFDTRMFVLPRGQMPAIDLSTVNLSSVKLTLARLTERNVVAFVRNARLGQPVDSWDADRIGEQSGRIVWQGSADVPRWQANRSTHTALPMPDALASAGPGLYALIVTAGDGTPNAPTAVQMILRTDFAPTIWRGTDGLTVQVRGYSDVQPRAGATLRLLAENNEVLGEATTDADGFGRFAAPLLQGEGPVAPRALEVMGGEDYTMLDLTSAAFDLSDRGVTGLPHPGPLDAYVWLDRGIFRPGETAQVMALLRDAAGRPADVPVHVIVKRPNGQVFLDATPARAAEASVHLPVALSSGAPAGTWTIEVKADPGLPPIGRAEFRVDAFVPDRMAVDLGAPSGPIVAGRPYSLPVTARFLYGAPAAGLTGQAQMRLVVDPAPFPALAGYRIGLIDETYAPDSQDLPLPDTDAQGRTTLEIPLPRAPDSTHALKASLSVGVNDPSGHASLASTEIPVRPAGRLIGIKPEFAGSAVDAGTEAAFTIAAVGPDGARVPLRAKLRLVRERPRLAPGDGAAAWRGTRRCGGTIRCRRRWWTSRLPRRCASPRSSISAATGSRCWRMAAWPRPPCGSAPAGCRRTIRTCRTRWMCPLTAGPTRRAIRRASISPRPLPARRPCWCCRTACTACATSRWPKAGTDVEVPVSADWGPGAYVTVHVFRTAADAKSRPGRAIGLAWVGIDPGTRKLPMAFEVPDKYPPRGRATVRLRTAPGAWVSLAAVDEGILRLTSFASPDPTDHFLGRRRLASTSATTGAG